jgi:hypothetical protein
MPIWLSLTGHSIFMILMSLVISLLITVLHRENIRRLMQGNERRWQKREATVIDQPNGIDPHQSKTL